MNDLIKITKKDLLEGRRGALRGRIKSSRKSLDLGSWDARSWRNRIIWLYHFAFNDRHLWVQCCVTIWRLLCVSLDDLFLIWGDACFVFLAALSQKELWKHGSMSEHVCALLLSWALCYHHWSLVAVFPFSLTTKIKCHTHPHMFRMDVRMTSV